MTRACGTCTLCCKVMGIAEIAKQAGEWCPHCDIGKGCRIYETRPEPCRVFVCGWLVDERIPEEWKPEKSKIVMVADAARHRVTAYVDPAYPAAWKKPPYGDVFRNMMLQGLDHGAYVFVSIVGRLIMLLPDGEHDVGMPGAEDIIEVGRRKGPNGDEFKVTVRKVQ